MKAEKSLDVKVNNPFKKQQPTIDSMMPSTFNLEDAHEDVSSIDSEEDESATNTGWNTNGTFTDLFPPPCDENMYDHTGTCLGTSVKFYTQTIRIASQLTRAF